MTQEKVLAQAVDITGIMITKLDGTAKGGIVVAIQRGLGVPVKLIGLGELVSTRTLARRLRAGLGHDGIFWKWRVDLARGEFLVTARA